MSLTTAQCQNIVNLALQQGDLSGNSTLGYFSPAMTLAQLQTVMAPLMPYFSHPMGSHFAYSLVQTVAILRGWNNSMTDATKLQHVATAVGQLIAANATLAPPQSIAMGGGLVNALAALT